MNQKNLKFDIPSVGTDEERKGQSRTSSTRTLYNPFKVDIKKKKDKIRSLREEKRN